MTLVIVGAGLAGLMAGYVFPAAPLLERSSAPAPTHNALLRFRTDAVARLTGIPFRRVTVRKGLWDGERLAPAATIATANAYSRKVLAGRVTDRSVWDLSAAERWVAPEDLYTQMVEHCATRIVWSAEFDRWFSSPPNTTYISTMPLPTVCTAVFPDTPLPEFPRAAICVARFRLPPDVDVHQTVYFPAPETSTYRASITGSLLIVESMSGESSLSLPEVLWAFGLTGIEAESLSAVSQAFGKIAPIDNSVRKTLIHRLTTEAHIYSVGRFSTWRNLLLDDVLQDLYIVKEMIQQQDAYALSLRSGRRS